MLCWPAGLTQPTLHVGRVSLQRGQRETGQHSVPSLMWPTLYVCLCWATLMRIMSLIRNWRFSCPRVRMVTTALGLKGAFRENSTISVHTLLSGICTQQHGS